MIQKYFDTGHFRGQKYYCPIIELKEKKSKVNHITEQHISKTSYSTQFLLTFRLQHVRNLLLAHRRRYYSCHPLQLPHPLLLLLYLSCSFYRPRRHWRRLRPPLPPYSARTAAQDRCDRTIWRFRTDDYRAFHRRVDFSSSAVGVGRYEYSDDGRSGRPHRTRPSTSDATVLTTRFLCRHLVLHHHRQHHLLDVEIDWLTSRPIVRRNILTTVIVGRRGTEDKMPETTTGRNYFRSEAAGSRCRMAEHVGAMTDTSRAEVGRVKRDVRRRLRR